MQPGVWQGAEKYTLTSKQSPIAGYLRLSPPPKNVNKKSYTVQVINHGMATLHQS